MSLVQRPVPSVPAHPAHRRRGMPAARALAAACALAAVVGASALTLDHSVDSSSDVAGIRFSPAGD